MPFMVMEWALPPAPKSANATASAGWARKSVQFKDRPTIASAAAAANAPPSGASVHLNVVVFLSERGLIQYFCILITDQSSISS